MPKKKSDATVKPSTDAPEKTAPQNSAPQNDAPKKSEPEKETPVNDGAPDDEAAAVCDDLEIVERDIDLFEFADRMDLEVVYRGENRSIHFATVNVSRPGLQLAGYYKHFSAERVQVMGEMETTYLLQMTHQARKTACETLMKQPIPCLIMTSVLSPCEELLLAAQKYNRVLFSAKQRTTLFVNKLSLYLNEILAPSSTIHAVLMDLYGVGVLMLGESGIGKSETALSLIERGHRLVADDAVTITRIGDRLEGTSPEVIRYFMEVRGIGIIDVRAMYGAGAVRLQKTIDMVVRLEVWDDKATYNRLGDLDESYTILGVKKPLHVIPVKPGRNLAVILEAAARTHRLNDLGFSAVDELNSRLRGKKGSW